MLLAVGQHGKNTRVKLILLGCLLGMVVCLVACRSAPDSRPLPPGATLDERTIIHLLERAEADSKNGTNRDSLGHAVLFIPQSRWDRLWPICYAREKLVHVGTPIVPLLVPLVGDVNCTPAVRAWAACVLAEFDDPRALSAILAAAEAGVIDEHTLFAALGIALKPNWWMEDPNQQLLTSRSREWLIEWARRTPVGDYDAWGKRILDNVMRAPDVAHGAITDNSTGFEVTLRWLDRICDVDLSAWLQENAPAARRFRDAELQKGYDPVFAFEGCVGSIPGLGHGIPGEGVRSIFSSPEDQAACEELLRVVVDPFSPLALARRKHGWAQNLKSWYWSNRDNLTYDYSKHRFVVRPSGQRSPATASVDSP